MEDAIRKDTGAIVTAEELWFIDNPKSYEYVCLSCGVLLYPASFNREQNRRPPYFRTYPHNYHKIECEVTSQKVVKNTALKQRITSSEGFPLSYPAVFQVNLAARTECKDVPPTQKSKKSQSKHGSHSGTIGETKKSQRITTSFRTVVNSFFNFPYDQDRELSFEDIKGNTYQEVFCSIKSPIGKQKYRYQPDEPSRGNLKVFYAPIARQDPKPITKGKKSTSLEIKLFKGIWDSDKQNFSRPYMVKTIRSISNIQKLSELIEKFNRAVDVVNNQYDEYKVYLVFVGYQDIEGDYFRYYVDNANLVHFKYFKISDDHPLVNTNFNYS